MTEKEYKHLLDTLKYHYPYASLISTKEYLEIEKDIALVKSLRYLTNTINCLKCGKEIPTLYKYCPYCGQEKNTKQGEENAK